MVEAAPRYRSLLVLCSALSLVAGGLIGFFTPHSRARAIDVITPDPTATPLPTPTPSPLRVYVSGAVARAAVYRLAPGSLVEDAVRAAGGPAVDADMDHINLAQELLDQQQVYVPRAGEGDPQPALSGGSSGGETVLVDINTATAAELEALPHIGQATAQKIIEYRETYGLFETIEGIMEVPGVGAATFEEIRDQLTTGH